MSARNLIAIDIGRRLLRALSGTHQGETIRVRRTLVEPMPADLDAGDPDRLGRWVGERLREADFPGGGIVLALARDHVGLKRMTLPTTEPSELPEMTRLALQRELPFDAARAVIDFVPVGQGSTSTTVLAVAAPEEIIVGARRMARAAGRRIDRIGLVTMGSAALIDRTRHLEGDTLVIDVTGEGVEFCVVSGATVRFSRAADLADAGRVDVADAVITETRRTWMSYRITEASADLKRAVLLGEPEVVGRCVGPIGEMLGVPAEAAASHRLVDDGGHALDRLWPLVGLLLETGAGTETIDFADIRRPPDVAGRRRRRVLVGAGILLIGLCALATVGAVRLERLEQERDRLQRMQRQLVPRYARYYRDLYRLEHVRRWEAIDVDWLQHAADLAALSPAPDQVVLDGWTGTLQLGGVRYDRRENAWSAPGEMTILLEGEATSRAVADSYRAALVSDARYLTSSTGAESEGGRRLPHGFSYRLRSEPEPPGARQGDDGGAPAATPVEATGRASAADAGGGPS